MDYIARAREVLDIEASALRQVRDAIDGGFTDAIDAILGCLKNSGKVVVTGIGKNLHVAEKVSATLASTGTTSVVLNPSQALHGDLGILSPPDLLLVLSYSGESDELLSLIGHVRRQGCKVVSITGDPASSLGEVSDIIIPARVDKEACPFNKAPTASTTAALAVGDALAMVLLDARGFREEDYAHLHPGGAIGRTLLVHVSDIMRNGSRLAKITSGSTVHDAVLAMTEARSGSTGIVDEEGRVMGIFTDGDLRRHIADAPDILDKQIDDLMTPAPHCVRDTHLAVEVLKIFEERKIDDILVVDSENRLVGVIDIQDLPKMKIM